jgi:heme/copper-type cytochrome/quinol oxidase subunit 2
MEVSTDTTTETYNYINNIIMNPFIYVLITVVIISYFILFYSLGNTSINSNNDSSNKSQKILSIIIIVVLSILILINAFAYFFSINIIASITDLFTSKPVVNVVVDQTNYQPTSVPPPVPEIRFKKQVFNIPGNYYNYENAKAICNAYGSDLATYEQIEEAYNKGGEWCNYGWSDGQMALFPTQKKTYDGLQQIPGHEHDCGRPGVNGGYIANPQVKFGVNCYGYKPRITDEEEELMKTTTPYPQTVQDMAFQKRVDFWKNKVNEILVSPFNYDQWSKL